MQQKIHQNNLLYLTQTVLANRIITKIRHGMTQQGNGCTIIYSAVLGTVTDTVHWWDLVCFFWIRKKCFVNKVVPIFTALFSFETKLKDQIIIHFSQLSPFAGFFGI